MPPGNQPAYTQLPDGRWIAVPTNPQDLARLKTWVDSYRNAHSEKGGVAALPDAAKQAKASLNTEMNPVSRVTGQEIPKNNDIPGVGAAKPTGGKPPTTPNTIARAFNQGATSGIPLVGASGSLPELYSNMKAAMHKIGSDDAFSIADDYLQDIVGSQDKALRTYGEDQPWKRLASGIPVVGPGIAGAMDEGGAEGVARVAGMGVGGAITGAATGIGNKIVGEVIPDAAANTLKATNEAYNKIFNDPKLSMRDATSEAANMLSTREISPGDYGRELQNTFEQVKNKAGMEKREFLEGVMRDTPDMRVSPRAVNEVLQDNVKNLLSLKERNPELFKEGMAQERTLAILQRELRNTQDYNLAMADTRRSQFWNYKQDLLPSMASKVVGDLDRASTQDITRALAGKDPALAQQYLEKSARYKELSDIGRADVLRSVFGNRQVSPDRVMEFLNKAPEESIKAIQTLQRENPQAVADMRRQLFEQSMKTAGAKGLMKLQPSLIKSIYGPQADAVMQFVDLINKKAGTADNLVTKIPGNKGAVLRLAAGRDKPAITIRASEMAKILQSSEMLRLFSHAMEMPAAAGPSSMMRDTLQRAIDAAGIRTEAEQRPSRVPAWKREGGGGENPPGGTPAPGGTPPPAAGGPGGAHFDAGTPGNTPSDIFGSNPDAEKTAVEQALKDREARRADRQKANNRAFGEAYEGTERRAPAATERRATGGQSPTGAERRTGAADRQLATLQDRLKTATGRDKDIIELQIKSIKENPSDPEYVDRRGQRAEGQAAPKASAKKMNEAIEKQRQRLKEFEEERDRILKEQGGGKGFDF